MGKIEESTGYSHPQELYMAVIGGKKGALKAFNDLTSMANGGNEEALKLSNLLDEAIATKEISMPTQ